MVSSVSGENDSYSSSISSVNLSFSLLSATKLIMKYERHALRWTHPNYWGVLRMVLLLKQITYILYNYIEYYNYNLNNYYYNYLVDFVNI